MKVTQNHIRQIKRHLSANGSILLPLALKWRLLYMAMGLFALLVLPGTTAHKASAYSITLEVPAKLSLVLQPDGIFRSQASESPVKITSDAFAGYTFTIKSAAADGGNALKNRDYSIKSISDAGNEETFSMNTWGFKWSKKGGGASASYLPGPTIGTVIDATKEANDVANEYTITLGAKVDGTIPAGNYSGSFVLMVTATPVPYTISYNQNTSDTVSGMPTQQTGQSDSGQVILAAEEPRRDNYRFIGWCIAQPQTEGGVEVCRDSSPYQASGTYNLTKNNDNVTLYAMWAQNDNVMQNWKGCSALAMNTQTTLVDIRDNRPYYVAKLADGNCWMTENLDLFLTPSKPLEPEDSDVKEEWTPPTTHKDDIWDRTSTGRYAPQSYDPGDYCWDGQSSHIPCSVHDTSHYHIGNAYDLTAAMALDDSSDFVSASQKSETSICPSGWQLPNISGDKSFANLYEKSNRTMTPLNYPGLEQQESTIEKAPYYFPYGGYWRGYWSQIGYDQTYWSNVAGSTTGGGCTGFALGGCKFPIGYGGERWDGFSVRCVAR